MKAKDALKVVKNESGVEWERLAELTGTACGKQGIFNKIYRVRAVPVPLFVELCWLMGCEVVVRPRKEYVRDFELIIDDGADNYRDRKDMPTVAFKPNCPKDIHDEPLEELPQPTYQPKSTDPLEPFLARARAESKAEREADLSLIKPDW